MYIRIYIYICISFDIFHYTKFEVCVRAINLQSYVLDIIEDISIFNYLIILFNLLSILSELGSPLGVFHRNNKSFILSCGRLNEW